MDNDMAFQVNELKNIIKRRKWAMVGIIVFSTIIMTAVGLYKFNNDYTTLTNLIVMKATDINDSNSQSNEILADADLMQTYSSIAYSYKVIDKASNKLNGIIPPGEIEKSFTVNVDDKTPILTITVKGNNQQKVLSEVTAISDSFTEEAESLYPSMKIKILTQPREIEKSRLGTVWASTIIGLFGGIVVSIFITILIEYLDTTIRTEEDIEKYFGVIVIGTIPNHA
ncbi:MAG: hypothetical protein Q8936_00580 [Bacillota bacterium]|nr:hypothetical protein [Bacillota bacterium]